MSLFSVRYALKPETRFAIWLDRKPLKKKSVVVESMVSGDPNDRTDFPIKFIDQKCPFGVASQLLKLEVDAFVVMPRYTRLGWRHSF
jgi:hypothetical protein